MDAYRPKLIDFFGVKPGIGYKGQSHTSTRWGIAFTILLFLITAGCFMYFALDFLRGNNPIVTRSDEANGSTSLTLSRDTFNFAVALYNEEGGKESDKNLVPIGKSLLRIYAELRSTVTDEKYFLYMEPCTRDHLPTSKGDKDDLKDYECLQQN